MGSYMKVIALRASGHLVTALSVYGNSERLINESSIPVVKHLRATECDFNIDMQFVFWNGEIDKVSK
jgi:hypothetical protein